MISIRDLGIRFENHWIFRNVSIQVPKNKTHILVGPSGSGKSTLLKCVAGLTLATEGDIQLDSRRIGMLFQKNALFDSLSLIDNLVFPQVEVLHRTKTEARKFAERMLEAVGLLSSKDLSPDGISGGMQKRLGIARALIVEPEIILYDEPTAGLDPITSRMIAELILRLKKEHQATLLIVTSDILRAQQLGDAMTLLAHGEAIDAGEPLQLLSHPDAKVQQFVHGRTKGPLTENHVDTI